MSIISRMAGGDVVTVTRFKPGQTVAGKFQADIEKVFTTPASVQPLGYKELVREDIGDRTREFIRIYTEVELMANDNDAQLKGDIIMFNGDKFEAQKVERWMHLNLPHFKTIAVRVNK